MSEPRTAAAPVIQVRGLTKRFPGITANDRVDLDVFPGEVHALVGENGAGKSTLVKILTGLYQPDAGEIRVGGKPVRIDGPRRAIALGIGVVHQHFMLIPRFTVVENIVLGAEVGRHGLLDWAAARERVRAVCRQYDFSLDPDAVVAGLSVGEQQRVEILKMLLRGAETLILDEPTAVLAPQEVDELFRNLARLREQGKAIVLIAHKLEEVLRIADRITVLRRGRVVGTVPAASTTAAALAQMMVGRPVLLQRQKEPVRPGGVLLEVQELVVPGRGGQPAVRDVSLHVREGEIYGLTGIEGNGQTELVEAIVGLRRPLAGHVRLAGRDVAGLSVREIRSLGVAYIPEDRHRRGMVLPMAAWENLILGRHRTRFTRRGLLAVAGAAEHARRLAAEYDIRLSSVDLPALSLSGGNQQKLILARELTDSPRLIVASQPTRGLDVGATEFVERQLLAARAAGKAVLLTSADLDQVLSLADRVGVMYGGQLVAEFRPDEVDPAEVGRYMLGAARTTVPAGTKGGDGP
ncbi:ABC transporter ATP-binding protein [Caldinitratiruptor microaerophilus]|nr:ABC transporter ATP-binding protein [Caldinitratiruptor microaerophilus]